MPRGRLDLAWIWENPTGTTFATSPELQPYTFGFESSFDVNLALGAAESQTLVLANLGSRIPSVLAIAGAGSGAVTVAWTDDGTGQAASVQILDNGVAAFCLPRPSSNIVVTAGGAGGTIRVLAYGETPNA